MKLWRVVLWTFILLPLIGVGLLIPFFNIIILKKAIELL